MSWLKVLIELAGVLAITLQFLGVISEDRAETIILFTIFLYLTQIVEIKREHRGRLHA